MYTCPCSVWPYKNPLDIFIFRFNWLNRYFKNRAGRLNLLNWNNHDFGLTVLIGLPCTAPVHLRNVENGVIGAHPPSAAARSLPSQILLPPFTKYTPIIFRKFIVFVMSAVKMTFGLHLI